MTAFHRALIRVLALSLILAGAFALFAPFFAFISINPDSTKEKSLLVFNIGGISIAVGILLAVVSILGEYRTPDVDSKKLSKLAVISLVLGIPPIGIITVLVAPVVSLGFAIFAFRDIYKKGTRRGAELAYSGSILSILTLSFGIPIRFVGQ